MDIELGLPHLTQCFLTSRVFGFVVLLSAASQPCPSARQSQPTSATAWLLPRSSCFTPSMHWRSKEPLWRTSRQSWPR
jgi:hypothetical protein